MTLVNAGIRSIKCQSSHAQILLRPHRSQASPSQHHRPTSRLSPVTAISLKSITVQWWEWWKFVPEVFQPLCSDGKTRNRRHIDPLQFYSELSLPDSSADLLQAFANDFWSNDQIPYLFPRSLLPSDSTFFGSGTEEKDEVFDTSDTPG